MSPAKKKQNRKVTKNATSALIRRERSSIRCSIKGALVASISFSSSSVFMLATSCGLAPTGLRRGRAGGGAPCGGSCLCEIGCGRCRRRKVFGLDRRRHLGGGHGDLWRRGRRGG